MLFNKNPGKSKTIGYNGKISLAAKIFMMHVVVFIGFYCVTLQRQVGRMVN